MVILSVLGLERGPETEEGKVLIDPTMRSLGGNGGSGLFQKENRLLDEKKQEMDGEKNRARETWEEDKGAGCPLEGPRVGVGRGDRLGTARFSPPVFS